MPFDLKTTMSSGSARPAHVACDDLLQLVHLEPVEHPALDGLDQVARLELRVLERVAADEGRPLEHDVVELALGRHVRADRADERALAQPLAAQHRVARGRHRDDDVGVGRLPVALGRLGAGTAAELLEAPPVPRVDAHPLDARQRSTDARDLRLGLPARADHAEARGAGPREVPRGDAARGARAQLPQPVRLDHRDELGRVGPEQADDEARARCEAAVGLHSRVAEPAVDRGHDREHPLLERQPVARPVHDLAGGEAPEAALDRLERIRWGEQGGDVVLGEVKRHGGSAPGKIRTCDLCLRRAALYPLSYGRGAELV